MRCPTPPYPPAFNTDCEGSTVLTGSCTAASSYWSSTTIAKRPGSAWFVAFNNGFVSIGGKSDTVHVRAVRGGL